MSESHYVYAAIGVLLTTVLITSGCEPSAPEGETGTEYKGNTWFLYSGWISV